MAKKYIRKKIKKGLYLYRGYKIKDAGYHSPDKSNVWEIIELNPDGTEKPMLAGHDYTLKGAIRLTDYYAEKDKEKRLAKLNASINLKDNGGELMPNNFRKFVNKLFDEISEVNFIDCACQYNPRVDSESYESIEITLSVGEHNRHIYLCGDDEWITMSYLYLEPTLGIWSTYLGKVVRDINHLIEEGKNLKTRDGNYLHHIEDGKCYLRVVKK